MPQRNKPGRRSVVPLATAVATAGALALPASPAHAADIDVPCDPSALVGAVAAASASTDPDTLSLAPNCVYTLTAPAVVGGKTGLPEIRGTLTVRGNNATIRRAPDAPQFRLVSNWGDLTLDRVTLTGGHAPDGVGADTSGQGRAGDSGGAIQNWGPLTITNSVLTGNSSGAGGRGADATATTSAGEGGLGGFGGAISSYIIGLGTVAVTDSLISDNRTGAGGRGGDGTGSKAGGRGGSGGFGAGVEVISGSVLRVTGSTITGNVTGDGAPGGSGGSGGGGGGDGGGGGLGAGVFVSTREGELLNPTIAATTTRGNKGGRGGDAGVAGPGGYAGWAGSGGRGGGVAVFYDNLTLDGGKVTHNSAGVPGTGASPLRASGGGIYTLQGRVALANGAVVTGNRPDNCYSTEDVPGCVNARRATGGQGTVASSARDRQAEEFAVAARAAMALSR
ncbi:hypothetical protein AB0K14_20900 [Actinosynnema sp. NPDC050801]|uniref:hypothetical protein n=1 Tax=unclassified Actinosynnema TaxID=2637065 RepID=UPI0033F6EB0D